VAAVVVAEAAAVEAAAIAGTAGIAGVIMIGESAASTTIVLRWN
jgi:hypothetical protein